MRKTLTLLAATTAAALAIAGCSTARSTTTGSATSASASSSAEAAATSRPLVLTDGGGNTFPQNFNILAPPSAGGAPGGNLIYEPLLGNNRSHLGSYTPWLATSYAFSDGGKTLTFQLRQGVTWSDGTPFTSADVKYTFDELKALDGEPWTSVSTPGPYTVTVHYPVSSYADLANFAGGRLILPAHIWSKENAKTWTNPDPVGTGPFTLAKFTPQAVFFKMRSDYWGGKGKGLQEIEIVALTNEQAFVSEISDNTIDWGGWGLPNQAAQYTSTDPKTHLFDFVSTGSTEGPIFNTNVAPYNNVHVRLALRDAVDGQQVAKIANIGWPTGSATGLDPAVWGNQISPQYDSRETQNVAEAKAELAASGYTVKNGDLFKDGKSYPVVYDVYDGYAEWVTTAQVIAAQWKSVFGLNVTVTQLGINAYTQIDGDGTFGIISDTGTWAGDTIYADYIQYTPTYYTPVGKPASGNAGRWQDPKFQSLMAQYAATPPTDTARLTQLGYQIEDEAASQAPFIPVAVSGWKVEVNTTHWTGWPTVGSSYVANATLSPDAIETLMNVSPVG